MGNFAYERIGEELVNNQGIPMKIIGYRNSRDIDVEFCDGFKVYKTEYRKFLNGKIINDNIPTYLGVGYLGFGEYKSRHNNIKTEAYVKWGSMLTRCYSDKFIGKKSYEGCFVCNEWHNFQNFAKWFYENTYKLDNEVIELDKEIKYKNCKMYSPNTCLLVPKRINTIICDRANDRGECKIGVTRRPFSDKFYSSCNSDGKRLFLGAFDTEIDAFNAYKSFKESEIKRVAEMYRGKIPDEIIEYIKKYEIWEDD